MNGDGPVDMSNLDSQTIRKYHISSTEENEVIFGPNTFSRTRTVLEKLGYHDVTRWLSYPRTTYFFGSQSELYAVQIRNLSGDYKM